jgi:hypothetical protein
MYKYLLTATVAIVFICIFAPKILAGLTAWSDRRWERRQERYEWRQDKKEDRQDGRFWRRGDENESEESEEVEPEKHRQWRRFRAN